MKKKKKTKQKTKTKKQKKRKKEKKKDFIKKVEIVASVTHSHHFLCITKMHFASQNFTLLILHNHCEREKPKKRESLGKIRLWSNGA